LIDNALVLLLNLFLKRPFFFVVLIEMDSVAVALLFFAVGQIILRKSFDSIITVSYPHLFAVSCLALTIGFMGGFLLLFLSIFDPLSTKGFFQNGVQCGFPFLAGVFFFIGLAYSIKMNGF